MTVRLRERLKNSKVHYFLDIYHKGKRKHQYIGVTKHPVPKTRQERTENRTAELLAQELFKKKSMEIMTSGLGLDHLDPKGGDLYQFINELISEKLSDGNVGNWKSMLKSLKDFYPSGINLTHIDHTWVRAYKRYLSNHDNKYGHPFSANTQISYFNKLKAALKEAVKRELISKNPSENIEPVEPEETMREFLTLEELKKLTALDSQLSPIESAFLFSCYTGLRWSDIEKLGWDEIIESDGSYSIRFKQQKTGGVENLPIPDKLVSKLKLIRNNGGLVIPNLSYSNHVSRLVERYLAKAGIVKQMRFHGARHTFATVQLLLGVDIYTVSKMLGHKDLKTTQVYAKIVDSQKTDAATKLNELL